MKKKFIVLFDVGHTFDARPLAESIEGENFEVKKLTAYNVREQIIRRLVLDEEDHEHVSVYPLTDFMDEFNDQRIDNGSYFMGYVTGTLVEKLSPVPVDRLTRYMFNYILVHVSRTWERIRVSEPHEEMPLDNIESVHAIESIATDIFNNDIIQGFLIASSEGMRGDDYWDKNTGTMSDCYIEEVAHKVITKEYLD